MENKKKPIKNIEWITVAVVVAALSFLLWWKFFPNNEDKNIEIEKALERVVAPEISKSPRELKDGVVTTFPSYIPLNSEEKIIESYKATYPNSSILQSTVVFLSAGSDSENFEYYKKWATDNDWAIVNSSEKTVYSLYLKKSNEKINIVFQDKKVSISHVK